MPNFRGTRFTNAHETLIWASKSKKSKYTFNYQSLKCLNDDLQMRSDWMLPICNGKERLKKDGKKIHSTQKPEALLHRIILATTNKGDTIFDPFIGTGTTAVVAKKLGRNYFGIEKDKKYFKAAQDRINKTKKIEDNYLDIIENNKSKPRVPFGSLVELGILKPGTTLFDTEKKSVIAGKSNPHEYFTQTDFRFWHTTSQQNNQTLVRSFIFHKPSGKMSVKSDNMITSGEQMYYYECAIDQ